tara:strand:- start:839 stop:1387 length:549 start_codon:yes stop_codon:yes gene_type:complete
MKKVILIFFIICLNSKSYSSVKQNIIQNLQTIDNISFNFEQNINGKIENGTCTIEYPKKIYCKYDLKNQKILISDGKSLVIKTISSFYQYPLNKTPLNFILDKEYLLEKLAKLDGEIIIKNFINLNFFENDSQINVFFDKKNFNLIGWQTLDIYQNLSITYLDTIVKNKKIKKNLFELPGRN